MIAQTLVLASAFFALAAGSCFEIQTPQHLSSQIVPVPTSSSCFSGPVTSGNVFSTEAFSSPSFISSPVVADNIFSSGCADNAAVVSNNIFSAGSSSSFPGVSEGSFSNGIISLNSGSSIGQASNGIISLNSGSSIGQATNGPESTPLEVIQAPTVTAPAIESPVITLSSPPIPSPKVIAHRCICTKTILKPQVYQRTVIVPRLQRYIKRTVTPVVENLAYKASPLSQASSVLDNVSYRSNPFTLSSGSGVSFGQTFTSGSSPLVFSSETGSADQSRYFSVPIGQVGSSSSYCPKIC